jgi:branched-chain amino acid transport system ATP-binding protein
MSADTGPDADDSGPDTATDAGVNPDDGILALDHLTKEFGGLTAVDDLSFAVEEGEILGFIGPNGAGKSTTFNCVTGRYPPTEGTVYYRGEDVTGTDTHTMVEKGLARTFQEFRPLEDRTILKNVALAMMKNKMFSMQGLSGETQRKAAAICERVGLGDRMQMHPEELPHAGLLRLELGRALATEPDLLLVDEPFAGLSGPEVESVSDLLLDLRAEGLTLVVVDHNMRGLLELIDRAIVINFGSKLAEGTPAEIKSNPDVQEAYLGGDSMGGEDEGVGAASQMGTDREAVSGGPVLNVEDLNVAYGKVQALRGVDLELSEGEVVSVIGPNGAGKTTLANAVTGYLDYEGSVSFRGTEVNQKTPEDHVQSGLIQCTEKRDLFGFMSAEDNLELGTYVHGDYEDRLEFVYDLFPRLEERRDQDAHTMSGGEQQMLAIGRSLMSEPDLLVLDEPTLGLAPVILEDISEGLDRIREEGVTVLLCEQNVTFAMKHADRIKLLENGEFVRSGTPSELRTDDYIRESYLGG